MEKTPEIPCNPTPECKYWEKRNCHVSVHHDDFPAKEYATPLEKAYRRLPERQHLICRALHDQLHAELMPPPHPSVEEMRATIQSAKERGDIK